MAAPKTPKQAEVIEFYDYANSQSLLLLRSCPLPASGVVVLPEEERRLAGALSRSETRRGAWMDGWIGGELEGYCPTVMDA